MVFAGLIMPVLASLGFLGESLLLQSTPPLRQDSWDGRWLVYSSVAYSLLAVVLFASPGYAFRGIYGVLSRVVNPVRPLSYAWLVRKEHERRRLRKREQSGEISLNEFFGSLALGNEILYGFQSAAGVMQGLVTQWVAAIGLATSVLLPIVVAYLTQEIQTLKGALVLGPLITYTLLYYYAVFFFLLLSWLVRLAREPRRRLTLMFFLLSLLYAAAAGLLALV